MACIGRALTKMNNVAGPGYFQSNGYDDLIFEMGSIQVICRSRVDMAGRRSGLKSWVGD